MTLNHHAVSGNFFARTHPETIAHLQAVNRNFRNRAVSVNPRSSFGAQLQKLTQRVTRAVTHPRLRQTPREQESHDPGGRLKIHVGVLALGARNELHAHAHTQHAGAPKNQRPQAPQGGGNNPQGNQGVHGGGAVAQVSESGLVERPSTPSHHRQGQCGHNPLPAIELGGADHGDHHQRH